MSEYTLEGAVRTRMLAIYCHCSADAVGNMPCDNGCTCDRCMTAEFDELCKHALHEAKDNLGKFVVGESYYAINMLGESYKITVTGNANEVIQFYSNDKPATKRCAFTKYAYIDGEYTEMIEVADTSVFDEDDDVSFEYPDLCFYANC